MVLIVLATSLISVTSLRSVQGDAMQAQAIAANQADVNHVKFLLWDLRLSILYMLMNKDDASVKKVELAMQTLDEAKKKLAPTIVPQLKDDFDKFSGALDNYQSGVPPIIAGVGAGQWEEVEVNRAKLKSLSGPVDTTSVKLVDDAGALVNNARNKCQQIAKQTNQIAITSATVATVVGILVSMLLISSVRRPLTLLAQAARTMASGDFRVELKPSRIQDEIGIMTSAFIEMTHNTKGLLQHVSDASTHVASSSEELAAGADETGKAIHQIASSVTSLAQGSTSTQRNLHSVDENLRQTASAIDGVSADIEDVASYATTAASLGTEGKRAADEAVTIIDLAATSVQDTANVVQQLGEKTKQIAEFIDIITGIADQTNLLALNAAIEAARAGDAGRGFAVVAEEVRKLAEESNGAAGNITVLVKSIETEMGSALDAMEKSREEVTTGVDTVRQASSMLGNIVNSIEALNGRVQGISASTQQIRASTTEVVSSMGTVAHTADQFTEISQDVSSATEEQSASMQEIGVSANNLARLAQDLQSVVSGFKI